MSNNRPWGWEDSKFSMSVIIVLFLVLFIFPFFASSYLLTILITTLHFVYLAQSWNLIFGYCGQLALGQGLFYGITGYVSTKLLIAADVTPYLGALVGSIASVILALSIGVILFRAELKGIYLGLVSLAAMEIFKAIFNNWRFFGSSAGIYFPVKSAPQNFLFMSRIPYYFIGLFMVIAMILVTALIERSKLGHRAIAVRENEEAAEASGIDCLRIKLTLFVISAFLTGLGGTFYAQFMLYISPEIMFGFNNTVLLPMLGVIVGGRGTILGPIIGSLLFNILGEVLRRVPFLHGPQGSAATMMFYGLVLAIVSLRYYGGLMGLVKFRKKHGPGFRVS